VLLSCLHDKAERYDSGTREYEDTTNSKSIVFSVLKTGFSASEIYAGIIHAGNLFDI
jgi:hypothetical protein